MLSAGTRRAPTAGEGAGAPPDAVYRGGWGGWGDGGKRGWVSVVRRFSAAGPDRCSGDKEAAITAAAMVSPARVASVRAGVSGARATCAAPGNLFREEIGGGRGGGVRRWGSSSPA